MYEARKNPLVFAVMSEAIWHLSLWPYNSPVVVASYLALWPVIFVNIHRVCMQAIFFLIFGSFLYSLSTCKEEHTHAGLQCHLAKASYVIKQLWQIMPFSILQVHPLFACLYIVLFRTFVRVFFVGCNFPLLCVWGKERSWQVWLQFCYVQTSITILPYSLNCLSS